MATLRELLDQTKNLPPKTADEIREQRNSWIIAEVGFGSDADEAAWQDAFERNDQAKIALLDQEAFERMERARKYLAAKT